jgi:hypothetical protein
VLVRVAAAELDSVGRAKKTPRRVSRRGVFLEIRRQAAGLIVPRSVRLEMADHILDAQLLALEIAQMSVVGLRAGELGPDGLFEFGVPGAERLDAIVKRHQRILRIL